jgi:hypothetical protein
MKTTITMGKKIPQKTMVGRQSDLINHNQKQRNYPGQIENFPDQVSASQTLSDLL